MFTTQKTLIEACQARNIHIKDLIIEDELRDTQSTAADIYEN